MDGWMEGRKEGRKEGIKITVIDVKDM